MNAQSSRLRTFLACAFLVAATLAVYWPARHYEFVAYDDNDYVYENQYVQAGLTWRGVEWALVDRQANNWHPLTWLSHMTDCQIFGLNPGGPHLVNVALHCANAVLLFLLLQSLVINLKTQSPLTSGKNSLGERVGVRGQTKTFQPQIDYFWRNLFVAALFALHPLRVESVAWISERKDVLSGFFGLLALLCYAKYAQGSGQPKLSLAYRLALIFFVCSLLSKPTLVTLPLVMLLMDYWPLQRFNALAAAKRSEAGLTLRHLFVEKWLFFLVAIIFCGITLVAQNVGLSAQSVGLLAHIENIPVNYFSYLEKLLWPQNLSFLYLRPEIISFGQFILSVLVLLFISALAFAWRQRCPALAVGWLWFLIVLLPMSGIVSLYRLSIADRYTYLPSVGFYLMVTWAVADLIRKKTPAWAKGTLLGSSAVFLLAVCAVLARQQLASWQNTQTLYEHALKVDPNNYVAQQNLHIYLFEKAHPGVRQPPPQ